MDFLNISEIGHFNSRHFKTYFDMVCIQSDGKINFIQFLTFLTSLRSEITDTGDAPIDLPNIYAIGHFKSRHFFNIL